MKKLKPLREKRNMSQNDLAIKLSVDRTTVTKWETTDAYPRAPMLSAIAREMRCRIEALL